MAKISLRSSQWGTIFASVENRGKTLEDEAIRLKITVKDLIACGDEKFSRNPKRWEECKRLSEKREKKQTPKKRKPAVSQDSTSAPKLPEPVSAPTPAASSDPMEELLRKKGELQKELVTCAKSLEKAEDILAIRQEALADVQAVLEEAQIAVQQAEAEETEAKQAVQLVQAQHAETMEKLQGVEKVIQELKEKTIYLVDPWFTGTLPEYGTFLSTVEMEGVQVLKPVETIEPDFKDMVSSGFDLVSEYTRALSFVSLVQEYILKGEAHSVLNTDPRVKKLLDKHIG